MPSGRRNKSASKTNTTTGGGGGGCEWPHCQKQVWSCLGCPKTVSHAQWKNTPLKQLKIALYCDCCEHQFVCTSCACTNQNWRPAFGSDHRIRDVSLIPDVISFQDRDEHVEIPERSTDPYYTVKLTSSPIYPEDASVPACEYLCDYARLNNSGMDWELSVAGKTRQVILYKDLETNIKDIIDLYSQMRERGELKWRLFLFVADVAFVVHSAPLRLGIDSIADRLTANVTRVVEMAKALLVERDVERKKIDAMFRAFDEIRLKAHQPTENLIQCLAGVFEMKAEYDFVMRGVTEVSTDAIISIVHELRDAYIAATPIEERDEQILFSFNRHNGDMQKTIALELPPLTPNELLTMRDEMSKMNPDKALLDFKSRILSGLQQRESIDAISKDCEKMMQAMMEEQQQHPNEEASSSPDAVTPRE